VSLVALILALLIEHGLTVLLRLREPRWLDRWCDWVGGRLAGLRGVAAHLLLGRGLVVGDVLEHMRREHHVVAVVGDLVAARQVDLHVDARPGLIVGGGVSAELLLEAMG